MGIGGGVGGHLITQNTSLATSGSARQPVAERGLRGENLSWATSWGCTGRTGSLGTASAGSPAAESPRWSWLPADSRPAPSGHTCGRLPSGCWRAKKESHQIDLGALEWSRLHTSICVKTIQCFHKVGKRALISMATASRSETTARGDRAITFSAEVQKFSFWVCSPVRWG